MRLDPRLDASKASRADCPRTHQLGSTFRKARATSVRDDSVSKTSDADLWPNHHHNQADSPIQVFRVDRKAHTLRVINPAPLPFDKCLATRRREFHRYSRRCWNALIRTGRGNAINVTNSTTIARPLDCRLVAGSDIQHPPRNPRPAKVWPCSHHDARLLDGVSKNLSTSPSCGECSTVSESETSRRFDSACRVPKRHAHR